MNKDIIKKELYKQKPIAKFNWEKENIKNYSCELIINGSDKIIEFMIPLKECEFEISVPAQLLIRWLDKYE